MGKSQEEDCQKAEEAVTLTMQTLRDLITQSPDDLELRYHPDTQLRPEFASIREMNRVAVLSTLCVYARPMIEDRWQPVGFVVLYNLSASKRDICANLVPPFTSPSRETWIHLIDLR